MSSTIYRLAALDAAHDRGQFSCGSPPLDSYLREQVSQDVRRRVATCFVALDEASRVVAYYTLASASVPLNALPADILKKLPRYPSVPAVRMGRLAVDEAYKGQGLGGAILADALLRALNAQIAAFALIVDAKDELAAAFYQHHGFIALPENGLSLFLPLATVSALNKRNKAH